MNQQAAYCIEFFYAKAGKESLLQQSLLELAKLSRQETGCVQYDVLLDKSKPELCILVLKYTDTNAMELHEKQPYITEFSENTMNELCEKVEWFDAAGLVAVKNALK